MTDAHTIERARVVSIEVEVARRGIRLRGSVERTGPCPICGGCDRFSVNTRKQVWNCRGCAQGGDVIDLVMHLDRCSFTEAIEILADKSIARPQAPQRRPPPKQPDNKSMMRALAIWREAIDPLGTPVERFLEHRNVELPDGAAGSVIRFHPHCPFGDTYVPAMVALVRDVVTNQPKAIHRTALDMDGRKVWVTCQIDGREESRDRLTLGPVGGGAVKLTADGNVTLCLGIGEGIESTLSMRLAPEFGASPIWSLLSAGQVARLPILPSVEALWIAVDHDPEGLRAARECGRRWKAAGREVFLIKARQPGDDLNDLARSARR